MADGTEVDDDAIGAELGLDDLEDVDEDDPRRRVPLESYAKIPPSPGPLLGPGGVLVPGVVGPPAPVPAATPQTFVCLRGPCRYLWTLETHLASGNPAETWDPVSGLKDEGGNPLRQPRQITRACTYQPGIDTQLVDDNVYACNQWDPLLPGETRARDKRRSKHLKIFPSHRDKD